MLGFVTKETHYIGHVGYKNDAILIQLKLSLKSHLNVLDILTKSLNKAYIYKIIFNAKFIQYRKLLRILLWFISFGFTEVSLLHVTKF